MRNTRLNIAKLDAQNWIIREKSNGLPLQGCRMMTNYLLGVVPTRCSSWEKSQPSSGRSDVGEASCASEPTWMHLDPKSSYEML